MIKPGDRWGPFVANLAAHERDARLRVLRAVVGLVCGHRGWAVQQAILAAERLNASQRDQGNPDTFGEPARPSLADMEALDAALATILDEMSHLKSRDFREVLGSYAATSRMRSEPIRRCA